MAGIRCTVCDHPERKGIEVICATDSVRNIAKRFGLKPGAIHSHRTKHLRPAAARAAARRENAGAEALLERLFGLADVLDEALESAREKGDVVSIARVAKELRETIIRLGQATRGLWATSPQTVIDARQQTVVNIGALTIDELRALARLAPATIDGGA